MLALLDRDPPGYIYIEQADRTEKFLVLQLFWVRKLALEDTIMVHGSLFGILVEHILPVVDQLSLNIQKFEKLIDSIINLSFFNITKYFLIHK